MILITNFHGGDGGGHTTFINTLTAYLGKELQFIVAAPESSKLYQTSGLHNAEPVAVQFKHRFYQLFAKWRNALTIRRLIQERKVELICVNGSADHRLVLLALRGLRHKPKLIFVKHNSLPISPSARRRLNHSCQQIVAVCEATRQQMIAAGVQADKIITIHNGIDIEHYVPVAASNAHLRQQYGIKEGEIVLGSVAGTAHYKRWDLMLATVQALGANPFRIVIVGEKISPELYQQHVLARGLQDKVVFTGLLQDVRGIIPLFDAGFVLSDAIETISFACREMMAMGVPVIVSDYSGLPENITAGQDGWVVDSPEALAGVLQQIAAMPVAKRQAMGVAARRKAEMQFSLSRFLAEYKRLFQGA